MNDRSLFRQYGAIEPDERFRLAMRASARDDHEEWRRLVQSCPMKVYRATEDAFVERVEAARLLAAFVVGEVRPHFARAAAFRAGAEVGRRFLAIGAEAGVEAVRSPPSEDERAELQTLVEDEALLADVFERVIAEDLAATAAPWHGFDELCREELGLDPLTVVAATFGRAFLDEHGGELEQLAGANADPEEVAAWRARLGKRWQQACR